ncbi:MAG: nitronate monooxygenase [Candidatus Lokiarchaeota archaeon]|nr:nitronate monooxygenase [Candidatus Lokiarchaeota archaeon]
MIETNITKMFGIKHPIFNAPMGPFYTRDLALAVCEAGGLGVLSNVNIVGTDPVKEHIASIEYMIEHTDKPFGLNFLTSRNNRGVREMCTDVPKMVMNNPKMREQCVYWLTSAGSSKILPSSQNFQELRERSEVKHFHVAPALWLAQKCVDAKVDGIVATGTEGGGHQSYEKVSTLVLLQQLNEAFPDLPKIACGGFATGEGLAAALSLGAGAIAMGSRFIASNQSEFHEAYKGLIPPGKPQDTGLFTGSFGPIRLFKNEYALSHPAPQTKEDMIAYEKSITPEMLARDAGAYDRVYKGDVTTGAVLLGQSIGIINKIEDVNDIIERVMKDAVAAIKRNNASLN